MTTTLVTIDPYARDEIGYPADTSTHGIRCGCCGGRHTNVRAVEACHYITQSQEEEAAACYRAELAYERHLEDRGYWDAQAQDDYEARMGVIPFDVAYAQAMADLPA